MQLRNALIHIRDAIFAALIVLLIAAWCKASGA